DRLAVDRPGDPDGHRARRRGGTRRLSGERRPPAKSNVRAAFARFSSGYRRIMRVLVVDDDRSLRDAVRRALTLAGYDVDIAEGGQHGLTRIAGDSPDAVVLDIGMPDIDGVEVCRRL